MRALPCSHAPGWVSHIIKCEGLWSGQKTLRKVRLDPCSLFLIKARSVPFGRGGSTKGAWEAAVSHGHSEVVVIIIPPLVGGNLAFLTPLPRAAVGVIGGHGHLGKGHGARHSQGHRDQNTARAPRAPRQRSPVSAQSSDWTNWISTMSGPGAWYCVPVSSHGRESPHWPPRLAPAGSDPRAASRAASTGPCAESAGPQAPGMGLFSGAWVCGSGSFGGLLPRRPGAPRPPLLCGEGLVLAMC